MAKRGNPGYGKLEMIRTNFEKFSPDFWRLMEEFSQSKSKEDKRFFVQEFNKIQVRMIPQTLDGDGEGGPIQVKLTNFGNNPSVQLPAENISTSSTPGS